MLTVTSALTGPPILSWRFAPSPAGSSLCRRGSASAPAAAPSSAVRRTSSTRPGTGASSPGTRSRSWRPVGELYGRTLGVLEQEAGYG